MSITMVLLAFGCEKECTPLDEGEDGIIDCASNNDYVYTAEAGCDGKVYMAPATSPYILPIIKGNLFHTGLTNCSRSFHGPDKPDAYAIDFVLDQGTLFIATREGVVMKVIEDAPSDGGGTGNYLIIDHRDGTVGQYYHSPMNGIHVEEGDTVPQGQTLGEAGVSGLAGYSHLHFIVTEFPGNWPYRGIPVSFSNVSPRRAILKNYAQYMACD